jgi:hypothetical protein
MAAPKHSRAPWRVNPDFDEGGELPHVYVLQNARHASIKTACANARLIAAAPDLLNALKAAKVWMRRNADGLGSDFPHELAATIDGVIAKSSSRGVRR